MHGHIPVLHNEVLQLLAPMPGETVVDATLGLGGHATAFLEAIGSTGRLIGFDADADNLTATRKRLSSDRAELHHANFRTMPEVLTAPVDIVFADLGLSSPHIDDASRGFTFRTSAPLDLRFDQSSGITAAEFLITSSEDEVASMLREFGELPRSRILAQALHATFHSEQRAIHEWMTTDVVACAEDVFRYKAPQVLPQIFQALRIAVNDEMGSLKILLHSLPTILRPGGRCGIISYHSLEDRMVKHAFRSLTEVEKHPQTGQPLHPTVWELVTRKAVTPSAKEVADNPRARSARLRVLRHIPD